MADRPPLSRLDLNLLVALDALLTERSVTRAAERLHLSQPALSASLARLRTHFDDRLLARRGNSYELTPLAARLTEQVSTALEAARRVFDTQSEWSPETASRTFTLYGSDYSFMTTGRVASALAAERAPGVRFRFALHTPLLIEDPDAAMRSADGVLIPHGFLGDFPHEHLFRDRWVIVAATDNERAASGLSIEDLAEHPWVFTYQSRTAFTSASRQLEELGLEPRVEAIVEGFLTLPSFIAGTDRLGLVQARLADTIEAWGGVRVIEPPFEATPVQNALWWHPVHQHDPGHVWMRDLVVEAARQFETRADGRPRAQPG